MCAFAPQDQWWLTVVSKPLFDFVVGPHGLTVGSGPDLVLGNKTKRSTPSSNPSQLDSGEKTSQLDTEADMQTISRKVNWWPQMVEVHSSKRSFSKKLVNYQEKSQQCPRSNRCLHIRKKMMFFNTLFSHNIAIHKVHNAFSSVIPIPNHLDRNATCIIRGCIKGCHEHACWRFRRLALR